MSHPLLSYAPLLVLLAWAAIGDVRYRRVPNWLTMLIMVGGVVQSLLPTRTVSISTSLLGILAAAAVPLVLFAIGAVGGGDVKLMAGVGAWVGPAPAFAILLLEKIIGLLIVLGQAALQGRTRVLLRNSAVVAVNLLYVKEVGLDHASQTGRSCRSVDKPLPLAVPVLVAAAIVVLRVGSH